MTKKTFPIIIRKTILQISFSEKYLSIPMMFHPKSELPKMFHSKPELLIMFYSKPKQFPMIFQSKAKLLEVPKLLMKFHSKPRLKYLLMHDDLQRSYIFNNQHCYRSNAFQNLIQTIFNVSFQVEDYQEIGRRTFSRVSQKLVSPWIKSTWIISRQIISTQISSRQIKSRWI